MNESVDVALIQKPSPSMSDDQKIRVLVIDDEEYIGDFIIRLNRDSTRHSFQSTTDPSAGIALVKGGGVDVVVTDISMPVMSGYEVMERVRDYDPLLPIIALTGKIHDEEIEIRCLRSGAQYFLPKPFANDTLLATVDALFEKARQARHREGLLSQTSHDRDLLQANIDNTTDVVFVKDREGRYLVENVEFDRRFGRGPGSSGGQADRERFPPAVAKMLGETDEQILELGGLHEFEYDIPVADGTRSYSVKKFPLCDQEGKIWAVCGIARDITERKRLSSEMELLSRFPLADPNILLRVDRSGNITYANPAAQQWLEDNNFSADIGFFNLFPDDFHALLNRALQNNEVADVEIDYMGRHYSFKLKSFGDLDACVITIVDITDLKRATLERETYYQAFCNSITPVLITDAQGHITHCNRAFESFYGYTELDLRGESPRLLNPGKQAYVELGISAAEYDRIFKDMWKCINDPQAGHWEGDLPNCKKDGEIVWVRLFIDAMRNAAGKVAGFVGMPVDVTSRRQEEMAIRVECYRALAELAEKRDCGTGVHLHRMSAYVELIAQELGRPRKYVEDIAIFAPLHDIGKVGIADNILLAPRKLTAAEFEIMKTHATIGYEILKDRLTLEMAAEIAYAHHERWDGGGYPRGLAGEDIPLCARILAVADVYDALRSRRPYKDPWPHDKTVELIREGGGSQFDARVAKAFLAVAGEYLKIAERMQD